MFGNSSGNRSRSYRNFQGRQRAAAFSAEVMRLATLERRELMTVTGTDFSGTEGLATAATTQVATFDLSGGLIGNNAGDFSATVFWGDGTSSIGNVIPSGSSYKIEAGHKYAIGASYTFQVVVNGKAGTQQTGNGTAAIADIPVVSTAIPIVNGSLDPKFSVTAFFTDAYPGLDAGSYLASVNWGDGTSTAGAVTGSGGAFTVAADHAYSANGSFPVQVTLTRKLDGQSVTSAAANAVVNGAVPAPQPQMTGVAIHSVAGTAFLGSVATFTDTYPGAAASDYSALITWKPGVVSAGVVEGGDGTFVVKGSYTYAAVGNYPVQVDLTRAKGGGTGTATSAATVTATAQPQLSSIAIEAVAGTQFSGNVASFTDALPLTVQELYTALITWDSGVVTSGEVVGSNGSFLVKGTHTFGAAGDFLVKVEVTRSLVSGSGTTTSPATVTANVPSSIQMSGVAIQAVAAAPFSGNVATFTDTYPGTVAIDYSALITWKPGVVLPGKVDGSHGSFVVNGSYTFDTVGSYPVKVVLTRKQGNVSATATSTATAGTSPLTYGRLSPASDTGASHSDGITNVNRPTFQGTAPVGSTVQLLVQWYGQNDLVQVGQGLADSSGGWTIQTVPLVDGVYSIFVRAISPKGQISPATALISEVRAKSIPLVIDTVAPVIASVVIDRRNRKLAISFRDDLSGMDTKSLEERSNYDLFGPHPYRYVAAAVGKLKDTSIITSDPMISTVDIMPASVGTWKINGIRVLSGGIQDVAGNALDGEYKGRFPTGNGIPGGMFLRKFSPAISNTPTTQPRKSAAARRR